MRQTGVLAAAAFVSLRSIWPKLGQDHANAKLLATEAAWHAAEACIQTHGGFGFAAEYDVERKWREVRVMQVAPVSTNLILSNIAEHTLGMPRSY